MFNRKTKSIQSAKANFIYYFGLSDENIAQNNFTYTQKIISLIPLNASSYLTSKLKNEFIQKINVSELQNSFKNAREVCDELKIREKNYRKYGKNLFDLETSDGIQLFVSIIIMFNILQRIHIAIHFLMDEQFLINGVNEKDTGNKIYLLPKYAPNLTKPVKNDNKNSKINYYSQNAINQINANIPLLLNISQYIFSLLFIGTEEEQIRLGGGKKRKTTTKKSTKSKTKKSIKIKKSASKK